MPLPGTLLNEPPPEPGERPSEEFPAPGDRSGPESMVGPCPLANRGARPQATATAKLQRMICRVMVLATLLGSGIQTGGASRPGTVGLAFLRGLFNGFSIGRSDERCESQSTDFTHPRYYLHNPEDMTVPAWSASLFLGARASRPQTDAGETPALRVWLDTLIDGLVFPCEKRAVDPVVSGAARVR